MYYTTTVGTTTAGTYNDWNQYNYWNRYYDTSAGTSFGTVSYWFPPIELEPKEREFEAGDINLLLEK